MAVSIPSNAISWAKQADGELWPVLLALAQYESGFDSNAVGDGGCSKGWLQYNTCGGLGDGHGDDELFDPVAEGRLAAAYIRGRLTTGASLYDALSPWAVRPSAWSLLGRMHREGIAGEGPISDFTAGAGGSPLLFGLILVGLFIILR